MEKRIGHRLKLMDSLKNWASKKTLRLASPSVSSWLRA